MSNPVVTTLKRRPGPAEHALTSIPWPVDRTDFPAAEGVASQVVSLFDSPSPRLRRHLLLNHQPGGLPEELRIVPQARTESPSQSFSQCTVRTLREALDTTQYVYRECE